MILNLTVASNSKLFTKIFLIRNIAAIGSYTTLSSVYFVYTDQPGKSLLLNFEPQCYATLKFSFSKRFFCKLLADAEVCYLGGVSSSLRAGLVLSSEWSANYLFEMLLNYFPVSLISISTAKAQAITITVHVSCLKLLINFLKNHWMTKTSILIDLWATDFLSRLYRFEVNYLLMITKAAFRLNLRVFTDEWRGLPSVTDVYSSADWLEREVWDMYGVYFYGHRDMRRILTDYGFFGHPLRKDFPVTGYFEVRYDNNVQRVVLESLNLVQELRLFNFDAPWKRNL